MGNLRENFTDEEWIEILENLELEKKLGKPDDPLIHLYIEDKTKDELIELKEALKPFFSYYQFSVIDRWISYYTNKKNQTNL